MPVTMIPAHKSRSSRRLTPAEEHFLSHQEQLRAFIAARIPEADRHTTEFLVQDSWAEVLLGRLTTSGAALALEPDLPKVLQQAARTAIFEHLEWQLADSPAPFGLKALDLHIAEAA